MSTSKGARGLRAWRYLDLAKLIGVLSTGTLPFIRCDKLQDAFEGSVTRAVYERWKANSRNAEMFARFRPQLRRQVYVSCWHANNDESEAMWRVYCGPRDGVALESHTVVADETLDHRPNAKIPGVCARRRIPCINLTFLLRIEGVTAGGTD